MIETTINIPFPAKLETDSNYYGYVDHSSLHATTYGKASKAKETLRKRITEQIEEALLTVKNYQKRALGTVEGSVFVIQFHLGSWGYAIVGPGRKFGGSCTIGTRNFEETVAAATKHANDSFGGIAWDCSL